MSAPLGILGGTFDPVHNAHLAIARRALEALGCARILWIPTGGTHYRAPAVAGAADRVAMLELALGGEPRYAIDRRELDPAHSGYTVDTLGALRAELGGAAELVLLMGGDQYAKLDTWHRPDAVRKLARVAVFARPGWQAQGVEVVPLEPMHVSASEIRARVARGEDIAALVPPPVADYIAAHRLYR